MEVGDKLIFDATSNTSFGTHPFAIVSALTSIRGYSASNIVSGVTNNAQQGVIITWDLTGVSPENTFTYASITPTWLEKLPLACDSDDGLDGDVTDDVDVDDDNDGIFGRLRVALIQTETVLLTV